MEKNILTEGELGFLTEENVKDPAVKAPDQLPWSIDLSHYQSGLYEDFASVERYCS